MDQPFLGSEALRAGLLTPHALRSRFVAVHKDVYVERGTELTALMRARAAFLRSRRRGVLAGLSASVLHGAKWIDPSHPAAIIDTNRRPTRGVRAWADSIEDDEICLVGGMPVTTPARTALDIASHYPVDSAVGFLDALSRATDLKLADVELLAQRYKGRRGNARARPALELVDAGAESPRETWLRLVLVRAGFPRPQTQLRIRDEYGQVIARADMGWENVKIAADYDGAHHRTPAQFDYDIRRAEEMSRLGWIDVRVTSCDTEASVIRRVRAAWQRRA